VDGVVGDEQRAADLRLGQLGGQEIEDLELARAEVRGRFLPGLALARRVPSALEAALEHPRVLRVPSPIVRFVRVGTTGLEFELQVFVSQLEDRLVVTNDLNRTLLAKLIEEKIVDPRPATEFKLRDLDRLAEALRSRAGTDHAPSPTR